MSTGARAIPGRGAIVDPSASGPGANRLTSLDAFRGFTMLFMASEILRIAEVAREAPSSGLARFLASALDHREWVGCSPWDLIQPSFMFMVGVSLPFSVASRAARGQSFARMFGHAARRALVLVLLGIFLRSQSSTQTYFTFEDVLTQIGLGYVFLFLLAYAPRRWQWAAAGLILAAYWVAFAIYPLPPPGFDTAAVGVPDGWPHQLTGFSAHWNMNTNVAQAFDVWFLNLFPREAPFVFNDGGYLTLNFVPSLATMIFGLLAGELLRSHATGPEKFRRLAAWGALGIVVGLALHLTGICPLVKRIWTPSWAIFSAGWATLFLAAYFFVIDLKGYRRWAFPLLVVGANSIAMYFLVHVCTEYVEKALQIHLGTRPFAVLGPALVPVVLGAVTLWIFWMMLAWMYERRVFIRI